MKYIASWHTVVGIIFGTLGKCDQRRLWKLICIVNPFDLLFKKIKKSNLSLEDKNLKWEEISLFNKYLSGWKIKTWPMIIFLTETVTCWFVYLLVFDRIRDAMCLNKMSRTSSRNIGPQHKKIQQYISVYTWGTFYPCVHQTHLECLLLKSNFLFNMTIEVSPICSSSRVWQLNMLEFFLFVFLYELGIFFLKPSRTTCGDVGGSLTIFVKVFWPRNPIFL